MALAWSAALSPSQVYLKQHRDRDRDRCVRAFVLFKEQKARFGCQSLNQNGITPKERGSAFVCASLDEAVEEKSSNSSKNEDSPQSSDAAGPQTVTSENPFVGAKISSRIAARTGHSSSNGRGQDSTAVNPTNPLDLPTVQPQASSGPGSKPAGARTFSPKPLGSQGSPFSSGSSGTDKLKEAKSSAFVNSRNVGGVFKEPGSKGVLDTLRRPEEKNSKFAQPIVPKNLFDEPEKLTAEDKKRFDFTFNAGQLVLIFSFLTIIGVMVGTAFLVWKLGAIHYNEY